MAIQESEQLPLVKRQISENMVRGDRKSLNGYGWGAYGKDISSYEGTFEKLLGPSIKDILMDRKNPVVVDLMAPSKTLYSLFGLIPGKFKFGLAVSLEDLRCAWEKKEDERLNVTQIAGDIMESSTWDKIESQLQGRKADLVMERALCGLNCLVRDKRLYAALLNNAWRLLSKDNGILIAEIPDGFEVQAEEMADKFRNNSQINALVDRSLFSSTYSIKMVKTQNSPERLPFGAER